MGYREDLAKRKQCVKCKHYEKLKNNMGEKCWHPDNLYKNWLGWINKQSPTNKNYNGGCKDYEEISSSSSSVSS